MGLLKDQYQLITGDGERHGIRARSDEDAAQHAEGHFPDPRELWFEGHLIRLWDTLEEPRTVTTDEVRKVWESYRECKGLHDALEREVRARKTRYREEHDPAAKALAWIDYQSALTALERHRPLLEDIYEQAVEAENAARADAEPPEGETLD